MTPTAAALARLQAGDAAGALALLRPAPGEPGGSGERDAGVVMAHHAALGMVLLAQGCPSEALSALRTALSLGEPEPATRLNLALAEAHAGDPARAAQLLHDLETNHPDWDEPPLRLAELARSTGDAATAEAAYRRVLAIDPGRREALVALGALLVNRGDSFGAQELLKRCCALDPACDQAWDALGLALLLAGDNGVAEAAFQRARRLQPTQIDYALHAAEAAIVDGRGADALARLEQDAARDPLNVAVLTARGEVLARLGRGSEAIDLFEAATALAPTEKVPAAKLALRLSQGLRQQEAERAMRVALALDPDNVELGLAMSVILLRLQRHTEARTLLLDLIERVGEDAALLCNLSTVSIQLGLQDDARDLAHRGIALAPDHPGTWRTLSNTLPYCEGTGGAELLAAAQATSQRLARTPPVAFANTPDPERKLRIGLLSGTLKIHPVGWLTIAGFAALDPARYELVCLSQQTSKDVIAQRFYSIAAASHDVFMHDDAALAGLVRELGIDVLIDLGGYGDFGRMPACARRLAPVQIKWVGMQNGSTGMAEMDWIIADRWEIPQELERFYSERPLRLADGYVCYSPPADAPDVVVLPALARGHVTFGCYNNLAKVTPAVIAAWAAIMQRVPGSRMVLKTQQFGAAEPRARIHAAFAQHGIAEARITLRGGSSHRALLKEYGDIDIVLDPFPYSGGLTTCEALWMGVPTVTFPGETFASRHSFSHLSNVGLTDWIAADLAAYRDLAVQKAGAVAELATLRAGLREQVKNSPLCDGERFGESLGAALRHAWQEWCKEGH